MKKLLALLLIGIGFALNMSGDDDRTETSYWIGGFGFGVNIIGSNNEQEDVSVTLDPDKTALTGNSLESILIPNSSNSVSVTKKIGDFLASIKNCNPVDAPMLPSSVDSVPLKITINGETIVANIKLDVISCVDDTTLWKLSPSFVDSTGRIIDKISLNGCVVSLGSELFDIGDTAFDVNITRNLSTFNVSVADEIINILEYKSLCFCLTQNDCNMIEFNTLNSGNNPTLLNVKYVTGNIFDNLAKKIGPALKGIDFTYDTNPLFSPEDLFGKDITISFNPTTTTSHYMVNATITSVPPLAEGTVQ